MAMTDWFTDELFDLPGANRIVFPVSRLVVDPERFLDDSMEIMAERGMGAVYTCTSQGKELRPESNQESRLNLIDRFYVPHHGALTKAVDDLLDAEPWCLVLDCHSFPSRPLPYEPDQGPDRPEICLGTDPFHTPPWLAEGALESFTDLGFSAVFNRPFAGALVPGRHFQSDARVLALMIEVNRSIYMDETSGRRLPSFGLLRTRLGGALLKLSTLCGSQPLA
jgi:N-formylglutamate amidohydrolase